MEEKRFGKNEVIFREGDRGNTFFEILEGNVGIYSNYEKKDQQKLTTLSAGQLFGEMGVIETWPRSSTAVAEDDVKAYEIGEDGLNAYFAEQPEMILAIMKHISGRIRSLTEEYTEVTNFLREAKSAGEQSDGFLAKMKKLLGSGRAAEKSMARPSAEWTREVRESWQKGSAPTMETLSIIAFKQPITKAEIEQIRGVRIERALQKLIELELIAEVGRKQVLGRPILYGTTDTFLRCFGINTLDELPELPTTEEAVAALDNEQMLLFQEVQQLQAGEEPAAAEEETDE